MSRFIGSLVTRNDSNTQLPEPTVQHSLIRRDKLSSSMGHSADWNNRGLGMSENSVDLIWYICLVIRPRPALKARPSEAAEEQMGRYRSILTRAESLGFVLLELHMVPGKGTVSVPLPDCVSATKLPARKRFGSFWPGIPYLLAAVFCILGQGAAVPIVIFQRLFTSWPPQPPVTAKLFVRERSTGSGGWSRGVLLRALAPA